MVGGEVVQTQYNLEDVLTEKQVHCIVEQLLKSGLNWRIIGSEVKPASIESSGFVGEYFVVKLHVRAVEASETLHLFVKRVPVKNQPKADFINCNHFYKREDMVYQLINELSVVDDPLPWCTRGLVHNEFLLVMVDLCSLGYSPRPQTETLDLAHVLTTISSVARFHAATANYETRKTQENSSPWTMSQAYGEILAEANFKDTPWMNCAVKLTANLLKTFSNKYKNIANLETKLNKLFFEACDELKEYEDTLNVLVHKDLWINNIMFRYEDDEPVNALLIDYQCLRYGPPTFDIMMFLYLTTSKAFREKYEQMVFQQYFSILMNNLDNETKLRLDRLNYDEKEFLRWCERSRKFGAMAAIAIFPYILMDPVEAKKTFDDPDTYTEHLAVDRSKPVIAHCLQNPMYRDRQVEVCEEFVERFVEK